MKGYVDNIEKLTLENKNFRKVLYTDKNAQLVLMSIPPGEDIGLEVHDVDQFLRIEKGQGVAVLDGTEKIISDGSVVLVPAGTEHNVLNNSERSMKLYTLYMPPHHQDGTVHKTKAEALADESEHWKGETTEG